MTDEIRQSLLDLHNELRNKVASGNETRNDQPPATNMNVLVKKKLIKLQGVYKVPHIVVHKLSNKMSH